MTYSDDTLYTEGSTRYDPSMELTDGVITYKSYIEDDDSEDDMEELAATLTYVCANLEMMQFSFTDNADAHSGDLLFVAEGIERLDIYPSMVYYIKTIEVEEKYRGKGLATIMLKQFITRFATDNSLIVLIPHNQDPRLINLAKRAGFDDDKNIKDCIFWMHSDMYTMSDLTID